MAINGYRVGRDISLNVTQGDGTPLRLSQITKFDSKQDVSDLKKTGIDGITRHVRFHQGWSGSFDIESEGGELDSYFAKLESDYYAGLSEKPCTITETITEPDGSLSQYRYDGVLLKFDAAGDWQGTDTVKQRVSFVASRRVMIS